MRRVNTGLVAFLVAQLAGTPMAFPVADSVEPEKPRVLTSEELCQKYGWCYKGAIKSSLEEYEREHLPDLSGLSSGGHN